MASLLRQIIAGPRTRHPEAALDLCYVTDHIIATSGPSQTYPQLAYRNPLDKLVAFLDSKHGDNWAIWEFRAEGTGYPDEAVYGRVRHYPWPDHHPPPFRLIPLIMASMRNWLHGGDLESAEMDPDPKKKEKRVAVVHCKAGKGRSGTVSCSYLISEEGWKPEDALARFTSRRMRPQFGAGVSIPSQVRWVNYVGRWTQMSKKYIDRPIEIVEIHVWGLRNGVKVDVEGFEDEGKSIHTFHTFLNEERLVIEGDAPEGGGLSDMVWDLAGYGASLKGKGSQTSLAEGGNKDKSDQKSGIKTPAQSQVQEKPLIEVSTSKINLIEKKSNTFAEHGSTTPLSTTSSSSSTNEPGGKAVILRPVNPIRIPNSDINISVERRAQTRKSLGMTMVTAVAHVWFNVFFEGENSGKGHPPSDSGVFSIDWEGMDGIKGTSRKGGRALDRMTVVWRVARGGKEGPGAEAGVGGPGEIEEVIGEAVDEPEEGKPVPQTKAADWKGRAAGYGEERSLGLRTQSPVSANISKASSVKSLDMAGEPGGGEQQDEDGGDLAGVKSAGPGGEEGLGTSDDERKGS